MNDTLVSVIIPCYNQAHLIPQAVRSCLGQSHPYVEIVVVDDGSPDDVKGALRPFGSRVKLIEQQNQGLAGARNSGLEVAKGNYLKFLDSDDWLLPHCIEHQVKALQGLDKHIAIVGYRLHFDGSERKDEDVFPAFGRLSHALCYLNTGPPHTFLFPTEAVRDLGGFNTGPLVDGGHEDYELVCRLAANHFEAVVLHTVGCVYRQTPASMSRQPENMARTRKGVWLSYAERLLGRELPPDLLGHLLGGYTLRVKCGDLRYEAAPVLEQICDRTSRMARHVPVATAVMLLRQLASLLRALPCPNSLHEGKEHTNCLEILEDLTNTLLLSMTSDRGMQGLPLNVPSDLAAAYLWRGRKRFGRRVLAGAVSLCNPTGIDATACALLRFFSYVLPGRLSISAWRCIQNVYSGFLPHSKQ